MKYYKVREPLLLCLLETSNRLHALEQGGVDNWAWYGESFRDFLRTYCKDNGIDPEQVDNGSFGFAELAEINLKSFEEIKEEE